jgi:hypothetical protein
VWFALQNFIRSSTMNQSDNLEQFVQERMLSYCRELGLSYRDSVVQLGFNADERISLADSWVD